MHRPLPIRTEIDLEAEDLAFGQRAITILAAVNAALFLLLLLPATGVAQAASEISLWLFLIQVIFLLLVFLPVLAYRLIKKRERPKLAASRALYWFIETLGLAA
ncbi:hypothetical protein LHU53_18980 [Rhodoferax sp. U2-2l]|uniref:hypothetical protein n=1 Tax=Rhodoferax sp. U2-2l TaxID=2884000 RepID=UPI001D09E2C9|nr:hypothetical protein [Rhodoferax sp. U2-2l]MCB8748977.1 hypothetical protein [Rhodoferax sp. U2-2l]